MTPDQRKLARHALGLDEGQKRSYRNRYFTAPGTVEERAWIDMVSADEAEPMYFAGSRLLPFKLTLAGARLALDPGETLDPEDFPDLAPQEPPMAIRHSLTHALEIPQSEIKRALWLYLKDAGVEVPLSPSRLVISGEFSGKAFKVMWTDDERELAPQAPET